MISPVAQIVVGVADMEPVRRLWLNRFGMEVVAASDKPDAELARLWGLPPDAVTEQLLLRTPEAEAGWLHVVRFMAPGEPVRKDAASTDLCPKNLDLNVTDMDARYAELQGDGYQFRSAVHEYAIGELQAREVQLPAHDDINVVLIEVDDWPVRLSAKKYGGITSFVLTVPDTRAEADFYMQLFGHSELMHHRLSGAALEQVIGLPPGAALDMRLLGDAQDAFGRVELIAYEGATGTSLYHRTRPPARGILAGRFAVRDVDATMQQAVELGYAATHKGEFNLLFGSCRIAEVISPAGFCIEVFSSRKGYWLAH